MFHSDKQIDSNYFCLSTSNKLIKGIMDEHILGLKISHLLNNKNIGVV